MHKLNFKPARPVPPIIPISGLRQNQDSILSKMDKEPVILSQKGEARAVLVSIEQWNHMVELLESYRDAWRAEGNRIQAENDYIEADTIKEALEIYAEQS